MDEAGEQPPAHIVRVAVDVAGLDKVFAYALPAHLVGQVAEGSIVRVPLSGRRVRGWVIEVLDEGAYAGELREVIEVSSLGPSPDLLELARFAVWRYAGWLRAFLVPASPPRLQKSLPPSLARSGPIEESGEADLTNLVRGCFVHQSAVARVAPGGSRLSVVIEALAQADTTAAIVLVSEHRDRELLAARLSRRSIPVARWPEDWAAAAAGGRVVVGTRSAVWARLPELELVVVLDAHASSYRDERSPSADANVLALERARRAGARCLFVSACPGLSLAELGPVLSLPAHLERSLWPQVQVLDRRGDDPRSGLYAPELSEIVRGARRTEPDRPVICVLNRTGRARLLACVSCGSLVTCTHCGAALGQADATPAHLSCPSCGLSRDVFCASCGSTALKNLRVGISRVAEELAALIGEEVSEVSAKTTEIPNSGVLVGTEAVLHRVQRASLVVFLDFDQELLASRLSAGEAALALLALSSRLVGPRKNHGEAGFVRRIVIQSRLAENEVLAAAAAGDPGLFATVEASRRADLGLPPYRAFARVSGEHAAGLITELESSESGAVIETAEVEQALFLVRAASHQDLCDAFAALGERAFGVRVEIDPIDL